jgi:hypothetical protein
VTALESGTRQAPQLGVVTGVAIALAAVLNTAGVFSEDVIHWANWLFGFTLIALAAALVFGWFVRRASRRPNKAWRTGLVFALLGLLTVVAFWSGLPPIFAFAGIYLGVVSYRHGETMTARGAGIGVVALGAVALVLDVGFYISDIATRV